MVVVEWGSAGGLPAVVEDVVGEGGGVGDVDVAVLVAVGVDEVDCGVAVEDVVNQFGDVGNLDGAVAVDVAARECQLGLGLSVNPHVGEQIAVLDVGDAIGLASGDVDLVQ